MDETTTPTPETLVGIIGGAIERAAAPAFRFRREGRWQDLSWPDADVRIREIANGLLSLGLRHGDRLALLSETRVEWTLVDFACAMVGIVTVPIYASSTQADILHILRDAGCAAVVVEKPRQVLRIQEHRDSLPALQQLIVIDADEASEPALPLIRLQAQGVAFRASNPLVFDEQSARVAPADLLTIIYTSGTTGVPKGCMLRHQHYAAMARSAQAVDGLIRPGDRLFLFLPLAHVFARLAQYIGATCDVTLVYAEGLTQVLRNLADTKPHLFPTVPRMLEKVQASVEREFRKATGNRRRIIDWALRVGRDVAARRLEGRAIPPQLALQHRLADRLVYSKVKARFGGELRFIISGGAALAPSIGEFFLALDIVVLEGYGLTESTTASCVNRPHQLRFGTVGPPLPFMQARIAPDGEILLNGPTIFAGYFNLPEASAESFDEDGWLRTGDVGFIDADGFIHITERKKDIIVTTMGKNVAPQKLELALTQRPPISQAVVFGDDRPYCVALVTIDPDAAEAALEEAGSGSIEAVVDRRIAEVNKELAEHEQIKRFAVLEREFSIEAAEMTATLKLRRRAIAERHAELIERLYSW